MLKTIVFSLPLCLAALACHPEEDQVGPTDERSAAVQEGQHVTIELGDAPVNQDELHAIATHVETLGQIGQASVKVKKGDGGTIMELELWGTDLPDAGTLGQDLKAKFPVLAGATILVDDLGLGPAPEGPEADLKDEDPEIVKQEVEDRLRADGVEGDITVDVEDSEEGRKVEVRVEKTCTDPDDPACQ